MLVIDVMDAGRPLCEVVVGVVVGRRDEDPQVLVRWPGGTVGYWYCSELREVRPGEPAPAENR